MSSSENTLPDMYFEKGIKISSRLKWVAPIRLIILHTVSLLKLSIAINMTPSTMRAHAVVPTFLTNNIHQYCGDLVVNIFPWS